MKWIVESGGTAGANVFLLTVCKHAVSKMPSSGNITAQHHMTPTPSTQYHHTRTNWRLCFYSLTMYPHLYVGESDCCGNSSLFFFTKWWQNATAVTSPTNAPLINPASVMWSFYTFEAADADGNRSSMGVKMWCFPPQTWQFNHLLFLGRLIFAVFCCYILLSRQFCYCCKIFGDGDCLEHK